MTETRFKRPGEQTPEMVTEEELATEETVSKVLDALTGVLKIREDAKVYSNSSAGTSLSQTTTFSDESGGRKGELVCFDCNFSSAPTTSESLTLTLQSVRGSNYATVIWSRDPSVESDTDILQTWGDEDGSIELELGDEVVIAYANTDTNTVSWKLQIRPI